MGANWEYLRVEHRQRLAALLIAVGRVEIEVSDADVRRRLTATTGDASQNFCPQEAEGLHMLFHKSHVLRAVVFQIKMAVFLVRIHHAHFVHANLLSGNPRFVPYAFLPVVPSMIITRK
jgi:hypothetical protein